MLVVEFRLTTGGRDEYKVIFKSVWPIAPALGELVNLNGDPYIVTNRSWVASDDLGDRNIYCYLRVSPFQYGQKCASLEC